MMTYPVVLFTGKGRAGKNTAARFLCDEMDGVEIALADPIKRVFLKAGLTVAQLWGDEKEVKIRTPELYGPHMKFWLSDALNGWATPVGLQRIDFDRWVARLPKDETTPRHLMQTFGTECVRSYSPDLWADFGLFVADQLLAGRSGYDREKGLMERAQLTPPPKLVVITDGRFRNEVLKVKARGGHASRILRNSGEQEGFSEAAREHASESEQDSMPLWWFDSVISNSESLEHFESTVRMLARYRFRSPSHW